MYAHLFKNSKPELPWMLSITKTPEVSTEIEVVLCPNKKAARQVVKDLNLIAWNF